MVDWKESLLSHIQDTENMFDLKKLAVISQNKHETLLVEGNFMLWVFLVKCWKESI